MLNPEIRGPACPLTGRSVADELQHAVAMLQCDKVGERDGVRYSADEFRAYCDGWYFGVARALAVMVTALDRRATRLETMPGAPLAELTDHHGMNDERIYAELSRPAIDAESPRGADEHTRRRAERHAGDGHARSASHAHVRPGGPGR